MYNLIVWSKDRPAQLELLLKSVQRHYPYFSAISVIFTYSNNDFLDGYKIVSDLYPKVKFLKQQGIYTNERLTKTLVEKADTRGICFSTDDTVIYRKPEVVYATVEYGECFSLRLGLNTIVQNCHTGELQSPLNFVNRNYEDTISWNPHDYSPVSNYGYCFGLDMCMYNTKQLRDILKKITFKKSNELEAALFKFRNTITKMTSYETSIAVNIPDNNMSGITQSSGGSLEDLNKAFLAGKRIDLFNIMSQRIVGCHQQIKLELI